MVERPDRDRIDPDERSPPTPEWEVFVRDDRTDPMQHVGSVRADTAEDAYDLASRLFAWYADDVWLCPAAAIQRYSTHDLAEDRTTPAPVEGDEARTTEWSE